MYNLIKHLPKYYSKSAVIAAILLPQENELKRILAAVEDAEKQMFISEATTALSLYEADLGITPNLSEDYDTRRNRILAKLRGLGTTTPAALERVVKTYIDGIIRIEEKPSEYTINIKFVTRKGVPGNLSNIEKEISEIIPAHIYVNYVFTYRSWNDVANLIGTWGDVAQYTWDGLATKEVLECLYIDPDTSRVYYRATNDGNAILIYDSGRPYARPYVETE